MPDPERIYLEPGPPFSPEGRLWCEDDVWPLESTDDPGGVEYVRADLYERCREALEPFALAASVFDASIPGGIIADHRTGTLRVDDFRRARRALSEETDPQTEPSP